tara:strand:- start:586 stop:744 length:159 start_codon:yes stop_codon:yes gene_type:complete
MNELIDKNTLLEKLNISRGKLDSMIKTNQIPHIRMGKVIRFDELDVINRLKM